MDPSLLMDAMAQHASKAGGPDDMMNAAGMSHMMDMLKQAQHDPELKKQMDGMWKMMDDMQQNDPNEYKKFVDGNMKEMREHTEAEQKQKDKENTITGNPYFCFSIRPAKILPKKEKKEEKDEVKLFDFGTTEIKESFTENADHLPALEHLKIYLNIIGHDNILPPLTQSKEYADEKDDTKWNIIPIAFSDSPWERTNMEKCQVLTYDSYVNTCVINKMKESAKKFENILHYLTQKFQAKLKDEYLLHKGSLKLKKGKKYKDPRGSGAQTPKPWLVPRHFDKKHFKKIRDSAMKQDKPAEPKPVVTKTDIGAAKSNEPKFEMNIPGMAKPMTEAPAKKMIQVVRKQPTFVVTYNEDSSVMKIEVYVSHEESAKDIDLDFSKESLILQSEQ